MTNQRHYHVTLLVAILVGFFSWYVITHDLLIFHQGPFRTMGFGGRGNEICRSHRMPPDITWEEEEEEGEQIFKHGINPTEAHPLYLYVFWQWHTHQKGCYSGGLPLIFFPLAIAGL
jgi:hypothetical protein